MQENVLGVLPATLGGAEGRGCPLCSGLTLCTISEHNGKQLRKCGHCGARFVLPQPVPIAVVAYFEDGHAFSDADLETKFERTREPVLGRVADYIQSQKRGGCIVDVGCATGFFLTRFFSKADWQVWGVELSPQTAKKAISNGIRVHQGNFHCANFSQGSCDVITVVDTFYYFLQPQLELAEFHRVLKADGMLVLELPLAGSRIWRTSHQLGKLLSGTRQELLESSDHLFYYNPKSIQLLLERCGFQVQTILPLPANRQEHFFRNVVYRTYWLMSLALHCLSRSNIMLGPRFLVLARKT